MIIIPVLALSALFKLANPDVTLHVSRATSDISVAHSGAEYEVGLEYLSLSQGFKISQLSLPGQSPLGVERDVQFGSPFGASLCSVPLSTSASTPTPTSTRKSSPTSRAVTHESDSLNYHKFTTLSGAICRLLASKVPSTGLSSSSVSSFPSTSSPLLSTPDFHLHGSFNTTSALDSTALPAYGPEWEWSPRDLVVYVPQPSCPVPVLRSDMSTLPTLHRCTQGSRDYYADMVRVAMLKQTCIMPRLDWCGRDSEGLQASLGLTSRKLLELAIALIRERELAQLTMVHGYGRASQPIALLFSALMYEKEVVFGTQRSSSSENIESPVLHLSQAHLCGPVPADDSNETSVKHDITLYTICIVALAVVYALFICVLCDVLDSKKKKENTLGRQETVACESLETAVPTISEAGSSDSDSANALNETKPKDAVFFYFPRGRHSESRSSPLPVNTQAGTHASIAVKFDNPRCLRSSLPSKSFGYPAPSIMPESTGHALEAVPETSLAVSSSSVDQGQAEVEESSQVVTVEQDGQDEQSLCGGGQQDDKQEPLEQVLLHHSALASSSPSIPEPSDLAPESIATAQPDEFLNADAEVQDEPEEDVVPTTPAHDSPVGLEQDGLEEGMEEEMEEEMEEGELDAEEGAQVEAIPLEMERAENSAEPKALPPRFESDTSLPSLSEWFSQEPTSVAGSSSTETIVWADSGFEKNTEIVRPEQEEQERHDLARLEEQTQEEREQEAREHENKRWEEKLAEIKLKIEEERAEVRKMAEATASNGDGSGGESIAIQATAELVTHEKEERWETVVRRRNGRGPNQTPRGSGGSGSGGRRAPRCA
ncbi:hypothetical protein BDV93DRAFT_545757 [Ceratobasidium sp. AG-I]|nr:hypothetical protein BDV93DRAFT_545757 [Ceratobasidium sp. AG-I]